MIKAFLSRFASERQSLLGVALLRMSLSAIMLIAYLWQIPVRTALLGPNGTLDQVHYVALMSPSIFALYRVASTPMLADVILAFSILVALAYMLGIAPRLTCWLFALTAFSNISRTAWSSDAGRSMVVLMAVLLCFVDSSKGALLRLSLPKRLSAWLDPCVTMMHNAACFLIRWQVCMVYFWAAFYKLGGSDWRDGSALAYVLRLDHFAVFPALSNALASHALLIAIVTYGTLVFQMSFPFLIWNERLKPILVFIAVSMHVGIMLLLGLVSFSATMIACDLSLLSDGQLGVLQSLVLRVRKAQGIEAITRLVSQEV